MKKIFLVLLIMFSNFAYSSDILDSFDGEYRQNSEVFDPLSGYNRVMTNFNDGFYIHFLSPVSKAYAYVVPQTLRKGIDNFFTNLMFPIRFVNNILQFKFQNASKELGRFLVNSIWGIGGFMDPATDILKMNIYKEDFGQTLGYWGVKDGFSVVLPFLGPSNLRDIVGLAADLVVSPTSQLGHNTLDYKIPQKPLQELAISSIHKVNENSFNPDMYEIIKKDTLDLYIFLRDAYKQKRDKEIKE